MRLIILAAILIAGYIAYQKFFNDVEPKVVIDSLVSHSSESIKTVSSNIQDTTKNIWWDTIIQDTKKSMSWKTKKQVCYEKNCYEVEIADTATRRQQWLMFTDELADDAGMLFVFETPSNYSFWMKNTKLTLDIIWLDESFEILYINSNTPPCTTDLCPSYWPDQAQAIYVLEVNAGEAIDREIGEKLSSKNL